MAHSTLFISHNTGDEAFVCELQAQLAVHGVDAWIDSRQSRGGDGLMTEIAKVITQADAFLLVVSKDAHASDRVVDELVFALKQQQERQAAGQKYPVVPLALDGTPPGTFKRYFSDQILSPAVSSQPGGVVHAPVTLGAPLIASAGNSRFMAPLGPIGAEDLRMYLEKYAIWPGSAFATRKAEIEGKLQHWGRLLYAQALQIPAPGKAGAAATKNSASPATQAVLAAWEAGSGAQRRFSIEGIGKLGPHYIVGNQDVVKTHPARASKPTAVSFYSFPPDKQQTYSPIHSPRGIP